MWEHIRNISSCFAVPLVLSRWVSRRLNLYTQRHAVLFQLACVYRRSKLRERPKKATILSPLQRQSLCLLLLRGTSRNSLLRMTFVRRETCSATASSDRSCLAAPSRKALDLGHGQPRPVSGLCGEIVGTATPRPDAGKPDCREQANQDGGVVSREVSRQAGVMDRNRGMLRKADACSGGPDGKIRGMTT